jgi:hypothetical protein
MLSFSFHSFPFGARIGHAFLKRIEGTGLHAEKVTVVWMIVAFKGFNATGKNQRMDHFAVL